MKALHSTQSRDYKSLELDVTRAARIWLDFASSRGSVVHELTAGCLLSAEWTLPAFKPKDAKRIL